MAIAKQVACRNAGRDFVLSADDFTTKSHVRVVNVT